ncbi:MAG: hypothetical protein ABW003_04130 [Microvirga sp.]
MMPLLHPSLKIGMVGLIRVRGDARIMGDIPRRVEELACRFHPLLFHHVSLEWLLDPRRLSGGRRGEHGDAFGDVPRYPLGQQ